MKTLIYLSIATISILHGADLGTIEVSEVNDAKIIENVSQEEVKSADLAQTLTHLVPSITMIRRSGIANDITLRGQKRDNIVISVDGAKVCGACPNRMDPPTSHIVTANIDTIKVSEGPFDVEEFGALSGEVKVTTKEPIKKLQGEIETTLGSFGYKKAGFKVSGGNDILKLLISSSFEKGQQYEDGDSNTLAQQLENANKIKTQNKNPQYQKRYLDMDAFSKKTLMAKLYIDVTKNQKLQFSITANRSDDVIYANSKMDALYDDSDIYNFQYTFKNLASFSKKLHLQLYNSQVTHPMSTKYRISSDSNISDTIEDSQDEVISKLTTNLSGFKLINDTSVYGDILRLGVDISKRNWDGEYVGYGAKTKITSIKSIYDVDTKNNALFLKYAKTYKKLNIKFGTRYNDTAITTSNSIYKQRDFNSLDLNMLATLQQEDIKYFIGAGKASRVPDARELYFNSSMNIMSGTPTLKQITNYEVDLGFEMNSENSYFKLKTFYSKLQNYIYFNKSNTITNMMGTFAHNSFENIDATIYGVEIMGAYDVFEDGYIDYSLAYQRGKKDTPLKNQSDNDLADITPLKLNLALHYDFDDTFSTKVEFIHQNSWENYDEDNGEQALSSFNILNIKCNKEFSKHFETTLGIDNLFNTTYALSNTYADLILLSDGTTNEVMLLNEPGRYFYLNLKYTF